jgi:hypothetical protein
MIYIVDFCDYPYPQSVEKIVNKVCDVFSTECNAIEQISYMQLNSFIDSSSYYVFVIAGYDPRLYLEKCQNFSNLDFLRVYIINCEYHLISGQKYFQKV